MEKEFLKHLGEIVSVHTLGRGPQFMGRITEVKSSCLKLLLLSNWDQFIDFKDIACVYYIEVPDDDPVTYYRVSKTKNNDSEHYNSINCNCSSPVLKTVPCGIGPGAKTFQLCSCCGKEYPY